MNGRTLTLLLLITALVGIAVLGKESELSAKAAYEFCAARLTSGQHGVFRNESLCVEFTEPLDVATPISFRSVLVFDAEGREVPVRLHATGRHVIATPTSMDGFWPPTPELELRIPYPQAGRPLRSHSRAIQRGFTQRVPMQQRFLPRPGPLELVENLPRDGTQAVSTAGDGPQRFAIRLQFSAPVSTEDLIRDIQIIEYPSVQRGGTPTVLEVTPVVSDLDPRLVMLHPYSLRGDRLLLQGDTRYQVLVRSTLESVEGQTMGRDTSFEFRTAPRSSRNLRLTFSDLSWIDPESRAHVYSQGGALEIEPFRVPIMPPAPGPKGAKAEHHPLLFTGEPGRAQILISGRSLPNVPCALTEIHFLAAEDIPEWLEVLDLDATLGYSPGGSGLDSHFQANLGLDADRVPIKGADRPLRLKSELPREITFFLERPFLYDGSQRNLVLDLSCSGLALGGSNAAQRLAESILPRLLVIPGESSSPGLHSLVLGRPDGAVAETASTARPMMWIQSVRYEPITTAWIHLADDGSRHRLVDVRVICNGEPSDSFRVLYQRGTVQRDGAGQALRDTAGSLQVDPVGAWSTRAPWACEAVRIQLAFLQRPDSPGEEPPAVDSILVSYRER